MDAEHALPGGFRWCRGRRGDAFVLDLVPQRRRAAGPLALAIGWAAFLVASLWTIARGRGGFLFLPIVIVPMRRLYRSLCLSLNRIRFSMDRSRFTLAQSPLPRGSAVELETQQVRGFRAVELDEYVGGWFGDEETRRWWSVHLLLREGGQILLPFVVPSEDHARAMADDLALALEDLQAPVSYRA